MFIKNVLSNYLQTVSLCSARYAQLKRVITINNNKKIRGEKYRITVKQ